MENALVTLCVDARRNRVANFSAENAKYTDEAIRQAFYEILGEDKLTYKNWRKHKTEIFEIIEEVLNITLPDAWNESAFYNELVEVKNFLLGQKNEFTVDDDSTLIVTRFSGNHWNTDRQKLPAGKTFSTTTDWYNIRVYDELERFLKGVQTVEKMFAKLQESLQKDIDARVYSAFNGAGTFLPSQFQESGAFVKDTMLDLVQKVQIASGKTVRIAGTKQGLAALDSAIATQWLSEDMKNEKHTTGRIKVWEGINTVEIPQVFTKGTYDFKIDDKTLFVLPENYKPIKLYFEGDTRSLELSEKDTSDMTIDYQVQTKLGVGVVFESLFGKYTIA
jgi:hypothetical protein